MTTTSERLREFTAGMAGNGNGKRNGTPSMERQPVIVRMADVHAMPTDWLWFNRIVAGTINLLAGPGGVGKSTAAYDMAARISRGMDFPDGTECKAGASLFISAEDDPARVIRPRLDAHNADVSKVHLLRAVKRIDEHGKETELSYTLADVDATKKAVAQIPDLRAIFVDPIGSFVGGQTDANTDNAVREVLQPINAIAESMGIAVICIAHHRKSAGMTADELVLGSRAFTALSRAVWHVFKDPDDDERRLMLAGKCNLARAKTGLAFTIQGEPIGRVEWEREPVEQSADEFVRALSRPGPEPESQDEAAEWLREALTDGAVETKALQTLAKDAGVSWRTVRRAKGVVGVKIERNDHTKKYQWRLLKGPREGTV